MYYAKTRVQNGTTSELLNGGVRAEDIAEVGRFAVEDTVRRRPRLPVYIRQSGGEDSKLKDHSPTLYKHPAPPPHVVVAMTHSYMGIDNIP